MRTWAPILLLVTSLWGAQGPVPAKVASEADRLKAKAEQMSEHDRGKIYAEIAKELTEEANQLFSEGRTSEGQATIKQVVEYAEKASDAAKLKNKKTKDTEITLRKTARRLEEIGKTLAVEDRPPVEAAVQKLDTIRKELLEYFLKKG